MRASTSPCDARSTIARNAALIPSSRLRAAARSSWACACKRAAGCPANLPLKLRAGDLLDVGTPMGRFRTAISPERELAYVAFAAGSGITPVLSLAADILAREPRSRFTLIYGNRSVSRTMFLEETLALKNRYIDRFSVHFVMSREPQQTAAAQRPNRRRKGARTGAPHR